MKMKKRRRKRRIRKAQRFFLIILLAFTVIYPFVLVAVGFLGTTQDPVHDWLVRRHFNITSYPLGAGEGRDNWSRMLATPEFAGMDLEQRSVAARDLTQAVWPVAKELGYQKDEIQNWFETTARNFNQYPVRTLTLKDGSRGPYRDLSDTDFPKPNRLVAIVRFFKGTNAATWIGIIIFTGIPLFILILLLAGNLWLFLSSRVPLLAKTMVALLLVIVGMSWMVSREIAHRRIFGPVLRMQQEDGQVMVEGQWRGGGHSVIERDNASRIVCEKKTNICHEALAELIEKEYLDADSVAWPIKKWDDEEIVAESSNVCATTRLVIKIKEKTVTQTRTPDKHADPLRCGLNQTESVMLLRSGEHGD